MQEKQENDAARKIQNKFRQKLARREVHAKRNEKKIREDAERAKKEAERKAMEEEQARIEKEKQDIAREEERARQRQLAMEKLAMMEDQKKDAAAIKIQRM